MSKHRADATVLSAVGVANASLIMALGTIVSRATGFARAALIAISLGVALNGEIYTLANTIPTAVYILVAGGIFNVVLVPQLVRAAKVDGDGGDAYANRVMTLGLLVLGVATIALIVFTPLLARVIFPSDLFLDELTPARESAYQLMRYCLPQVFFYGAFVIVGQILNSRGRFGPMMWAPIVNNIVSVALLVAYLVVYGAAGASERDGFTSTQEVWLGIGSTLGIALQAAVLLPSMRAAGFRFRPRFDFRGVGLGHTLRLGLWTLLFVIVNQIVFVVVQRLAASSATTAALEGGQSAGATVYQFGFLISQVPHGIITVSVLTAVIPRLSQLSAERRLDDMRAALQDAMRMVLAAVVPIAVAVAALGHPVAVVMASYGGLAGSTGIIGDTIVAFAPGMVVFSMQYIVLRGFYADEDTRTPFLVQVVLGSTNIALAVALTRMVDTDRFAMVLALAWGGAYAVGLAVSSVVLSRRLGGRVFDTRLLGWLLRVALAAAAAGVVMVAVVRAGEYAGAGDGSVLWAAGQLAVGGPLGAIAYLVVARLLRIREAGAVLRAVRGRR